MVGWRAGVGGAAGAEWRAGGQLAKSEAFLAQCTFLESQWACMTPTFSYRWRPPEWTLGQFLGRGLAWQRHHQTMRTSNGEFGSCLAFVRSSLHSVDKFGWIPISPTKVG